MILEMKEYCFASVLELLDQMEKSMKYYLKKELIDLKNENIEKIFYIQERKKKAAQKKIIEIAGFMYTLVFGLTAIYETIDVLNKTFHFVIEKSELIAKVSFYIWIVIVIAILSFLLKEPIRKLVYACMKKRKNFNKMQ